MTLNQLIDAALKLKEQGYGELKVVLNSEYNALDLEHVKTPFMECIDISGN